MRSVLWGIAALLAIGAGGQAEAKEVANPRLRVWGDPVIGPASVPVMEQMFWVQLPLNPATEVKVTCPEGVRLLDKTKPTQNNTGWTRLYFRADRPIKDGKIVLQPEGRPERWVPLRVLSYREDVEDKSRDLPGFSTSVRKRGRSFYTDEMVARAKRNVAVSERLRAEVMAGSQFDGMSDEEVWQSLQSWSVPRSVYSDWPCPDCGTKVLEISGYSAWKAVDRFHAQCPVCGRVFPTNDIAKDDYSSGDYPDDGWGYDSTGSGTRQDAWAWAAYANDRNWRNLDINHLGLRWLLGGDREAAHRAGLLLARMAYVYPGMDTRWQLAKLGSGPGKIQDDPSGESHGLMSTTLRAYDAVWDFLGQDQALADFLHTKDPTIKTPEDVRRLIDVYLIQEYGLNMMQREYSGGNFGSWEFELIQAALIANMGEASERWLKEVFTHAGDWGSIAGGVQDKVTNHCTREGLANDGALGYSYGGITSWGHIAAVLERYPDLKWRERCDLYDEKRFPRFCSAFDGYLDLAVSRFFMPNFGDCGDPASASELRNYPVNDTVLYVPDMYLQAYSHSPSDRFAWELMQVKDIPSEGRDELWGDGQGKIWAKVEAQARNAGPPPPLQSRVLDDTGMAILEVGYDEPEVKDRAGLALRYGYGYRTHQHHDALNVQYWAKGMCMVPELGYPGWTSEYGSTGDIQHHITGMIDDELEQYPGATGKGTLEAFANAPEAAFADVSAKPTAFEAEVYRRGTALLQAPGKNSYVFDVLRLKGGAKRTFTFHGPVCEDFASNLRFGETGEVVYDNLVQPQWATSDGDATATWTVQGKPLFFRMHMLGQPQREYLTARFGKPDSPPIRMFFAQDQKAGGQSEFVSVWEPYEGESFIEKVERLEISGGNEPEGFDPVAVRVTLAGGRTDTILYTYDAASLHRIGDIEFRGSFGYISEQNGLLRALHLVGGDTLLKSGEGIRAQVPGYTARVIEADLDTYRFTLDRILPADGRLDGRQLRVLAGGGIHRVSYTIRQVLPPGDVVEVNLSPLIFQSPVESIDEGARTIFAEIPPTVEEKSFRCPPGFYNGALLTDETRTARYRVQRVDGKRIVVGPVKAADFRARDVFDREMLYIYDFGEGDTVTVDGSVFVRKGEDGEWEGESTSDFTLLIGGSEGLPQPVKLGSIE